MITEIEKITDESIEKAVRILRDGGIIGMPTETVYGLAGVGTDSEAVKKIYEAKGRPSDNPLIAHVHKDYDIEKLVYVNQPYALELKKRFSPGPLTLVFDSKNVICKEAVCGGDTLAIRIPSHEGCQKLLRSIDLPIVAPSANISKHTSPVTAEHVFRDMNGKIPLILDGGKCTGGIESTVVDVTGEYPRILRAGLITREMIASVCGKCEIAEHKEGDRVKSPGVKYRHYRPKCETAYFPTEKWEDAVKLYDQYKSQGKRPFIMCDGEDRHLFGDRQLLFLGNTGEEIASNLYDKLLEGELKADIIIAVITPREDGVYLGIMNRLLKSCG